MKKFYAMVTLLALAFAGCKKDKPVEIVNPPEPSDDIYVEATFASDGVLSDYDFEWSAADAISFCDAENTPVELKAAEVAADKRSATFGPLDKEAAGRECYAAYPAASASLSCDGASPMLAFSLATVQNGALNPVFYAADRDKTAPVDMKFAPVTSVIELTLGFDATKVTIGAYDNESLAGDYKYALADGGCELVREGGESMVVLENLSAGVHYANVAAVNLSRGLRVVYETADGAMVETYCSGGINLAEEPAKIACEEFAPIALTFAAESPEAETLSVSGSFAGISSILLNRIVLVGLGDTETPLDISGKTFSKTFAEVAEGTYTLFARLYYDNTHVDSQAVTVNVMRRGIKNSEIYAEYEISVTAEGEVEDNLVKSWNDAGAVTFAISLGEIPVSVVKYYGLQWSTHIAYGARSSAKSEPVVPQPDADGKCWITVPTSEVIRLGTGRYYFRGYIIFEDEQTSADDDVYKYSPNANNIGNEGGGSNDYFQYSTRWTNY